MVRKRAPGGGRKPQGKFHGKSEMFSTRLTPELLTTLKRERDREQKRSGKKCSLSQIVEELLRRALDKPKRSKKALGSADNHALGRSVSRIARDIEGYTGEQWRRSAFSFEALKSAIEFFLPLLAHGDKIHVPPGLEERYEADLEFYNTLEPHRREHFPKPKAERYRNPAAVGSEIGRAFWDKLNTYETPPTDRPGNQYYADDFHDLPELREEFGLAPRKRREK